MKFDLKNYYTTQLVPYFLLSTRYNYNIPEQVPKLIQITVSRGIGDANKNPKELDSALEELSLITGQCPQKNKAKKAVAGFKIREGMPVGVSVTLRKNKMYSFLTRLIHVALPRVRDFRGLTLEGFDGQGNYNLGLNEQLIFPEISYERVNALRGFNISIETTAKTDIESLILLKLLGMPFNVPI
jgi:large subunit ribosomal protein L5